MTTKKKYTVHVTFSADKTYEVEAEDEYRAIEQGDELAEKEIMADLDFYSEAHYAEEGWDEQRKFRVEVDFVGRKFYELTATSKESASNVIHVIANSDGLTDSEIRLVQVVGVVEISE